MRAFERCEFHGGAGGWCEEAGLVAGPRLKSLRYWPQTPVNTPSALSIDGEPAVHGDLRQTSGQQTSYRVMTDSRELSSYCQESVRPSHSRRWPRFLNLEVPEAITSW